MLSAAPTETAALVNLNHAAQYVRWSFVNLSIPNLVVIVLMVAVFALAVLVPLPDRHGDLPPTHESANETDGRPSAP